MPHTLDLNRLDEVFEVIEANINKLTTWEIDFIEDVKPRWESGKTLADGTLEKLEEIYLKV
jgi:hypothetical protein